MTRFPCESIARDLAGAGATLIRVNPTEPDVPTDIASIGLPAGHEIIHDFEALLDQVGAASTAAGAAAEEGRGKGASQSAVGDWKTMMARLR